MSMNDNKQHRHEIDKWWSLRMTPADLADVGFEALERGPEAKARDVAYVQNAYATLSRTRELVWCGARAGVRAGAALVAVFAILLVAVNLAAQSLDGGQFATIYGNTPLVGTSFEPLWPLLLALPMLPFFAVVGAVAALLRRVGNHWRRALHAYFTPVNPLLDQVFFWLMTSALIAWITYALGLVGLGTDVLGMLFLVAGAGGLISWPVFQLWRKWYLELIRSAGSASIDEIRAYIRRQY
jgi:hypothetical protein